MKLTSFTLVFLLFFSVVAKGQLAGTELYSETVRNGVRIQNSFPKGGPYLGGVKTGFNHSYLVFYTRIVNETENPITFEVNFDGTPFAIPGAPDTFMKLLLPSATMTAEKRSLFSYGIDELTPLGGASQFKKTLNPEEECFFYTVAFFYQTREDILPQDRGGNRGEFTLEGETLFYRILPQVEALRCGSVAFL
jgi:hypothetical protein